MEKFFDREAAGKVLAEQLKEYAKKPNTLILALPRGGVPVAYEIAKALSLPLDVFIVRKLGVPGHEELAMGAIAMGGAVIFNEDIVKSLHISKFDIQQAIQAEQQELERRELLYRDRQELPEITGKTIILVDDGIATGATLRAAIQSLKQKKPRHIIVAAPVAAFSTCEELKNEVDEIVCPFKAENFYAVGVWYEHFPQTSDKEVSALLKKVRQKIGS
ncbi:MAG: Phosphoribosyltransferase [uncultured bacterium]|nr:MAG: Phosphoribosyltransferase [uncultured bacterium]